MAVAANTLSLYFIVPSSSSSSSALKHKPQFADAMKRFVSLSAPSSYSSSTSLEGRSRKSTLSTISTALAAVVDKKQGINGEKSLHPENDDVSGEEKQKNLERPSELYVCNLPRSYDAAQLLDMFKPYGTVLSVQICRNAKTRRSKGCGYVTMASINSARNAVTALDGSDVDGREVRVRFSVEMNRGRRDPQKVCSPIQTVLYYESPHKLYVGNLARDVRPEELRNLFSRFGTVVSARVLHDHKQGKGRVYAFVSFLKKKERNSAMSLNGTELCGRELAVRSVEEWTEP